MRAFPFLRESGARRPIGRDSAASLRGWVANLEAVLLRRIASPLMHPALVYADADGCGHIGAVIYHKGMAYRASAHLPPGLRPVEIGFASMGSLQLFLA